MALAMEPPTEEKGLLDSLGELTKETFAEKAKTAIAPVQPPAQPAKPSTETPTKPPESPKTVDPLKKTESDEEETPPADAAPKAKLDWSRATEARKQIKAENKKLKEQLAQAKTDPAVEAIKKENEELHRQLETVAIERSPRFQNQFSSEANAIVEVAKAGLPKIADKVEAILRLPAGDYRAAQIEAVAGDLSASQATALNVALLDMDKLNYRKNLVLTNQRDSWMREMREAESRRENESKAQKQQWQETFEETLNSAQENLAMYQPREGDEAWNKEVQSSIELARRVYAGEDMEPVDLAKTALWAAAAPKILAQNLALIQENEALKKQVGDIGKATPSPGSGQATEPSGQQSDKGFIDTAIEEALKAGFIRTR